MNRRLPVNRFYDGRVLIGSPVKGEDELNHLPWIWDVVFDQGNCDVGYFLDITERLQATALLEAVSHFENISVIDDSCLVVWVSEVFDWEDVKVAGYQEIGLMGRLRVHDISLLLVP
jgi:hypothetical protein